MQYLPSLNVIFMTIQSVHLLISMSYLLEGLLNQVVFSVQEGEALKFLGKDLLEQAFLYELISFEDAPRRLGQSHCKPVGEPEME